MISMKSILKIQKDSVNTLKEEMLAHSNSKLKKIYIVSSDLRETGYDIIEECLSLTSFMFIISQLFML